MSKILVKKETSIKKLYERLYSLKQFLVEETIIQHKDLDKLNPYAVNSFRIVTLLKDGKVYVLNNALRINVDKEVSIGCQDAYMKLNENGTLASPVVDDIGNILKKHPLTGQDLTKIKVPYVKEAFEMVKKAALVVPEIRYIGWDVAFTKKGPIIVEGNEYPSYGLIQYYLLSDNPKEGHLGQLSKILKEEMNNIKL